MFYIRPSHGLFAQDQLIYTRFLKNNDENSCCSSACQDFSNGYKKGKIVVCGEFCIFRGC